MPHSFYPPHDYRSRTTSPASPSTKSTLHGTRLRNPDPSSSLSSTDTDKNNMTRPMTLASSRSPTTRSTANAITTTRITKTTTMGNKNSQKEKTKNHLSELGRVRRLWPMASTVHFFDTFNTALRLSQRVPHLTGLITPDMIEKAVANPVHYNLVGFYGALLKSLVGVICGKCVGKDKDGNKGVNEIQNKSEGEDRNGLIKKNNSDDEEEEEEEQYNSVWWWKEIKKIVNDDDDDDERGIIIFDEFWNCGESLRRYRSKNWENWVRNVSWGERLGLLYNLCCLIASESELFREEVRIRMSARKKENDGKTRKFVGGGETGGVRLKPIGRCSKKRFYWSAGSGRIYSGYKSTGCGGLAVECSDEATMEKLVARLVARADSEGSGSLGRDRLLGSRIRDLYLRPLIEEGEKRKKQAKRMMALATAREEARLWNLSRPRRTKAAYSIAK